MGWGVKSVEGIRKEGGGRIQKEGKGTVKGSSRFFPLSD